MKYHSCEVFIDMSVEVRPFLQIYFFLVEKTINEFYLVALCANYRVHFYSPRVVVMHEEIVQNLFDRLKGFIHLLMRKHCHLSSCFF